MDAESGQLICGCGHRIADHDTDHCREWWRQPDVLNARPCGCRGAWRPGPEDSRYSRWADQERQAGGFARS